MTATAEPQAPEHEIGRDRRRKEDQRLITGRTRWTDNIAMPGMLHLAMVRSPFAHAKIVGIDTEAAKSAPNVVSVVTGKDVADVQGSLPNAWAITPDQVAPPHPPVAVDRVAFAGEIVAVVVARSAAEAGTGGDVDEAIAKARDGGILIEREYRQQRLIPAFMEPRSVVVDPTGEQITMWSATQIPHILRFLLAAVLGISESKIRVIAPDVGGGFGGKLQTTPEEFITMVLARQLGKPVKYTETRSESLMSA